MVQIMVPGRTNVSLTLSWSTDYDPISAAEQPGAAKQGPKGDPDSEVSTACPHCAVCATVAPLSLSEALVHSLPLKGCCPLLLFARSLCGLVGIHGT